MAGPKKKTKLTAAKVRTRQSRRGKASKKSLAKLKKDAAEIAWFEQREADLLALKKLKDKPVTEEESRDCSITVSSQEAAAVPSTTTEGKKSSAAQL
eukprot:m.474706 g.474706  ORF g.474706 m.474706 type:complete len:97 (-) comp21679_c0_seq3:2686-2976(-)